MRDMDSKISFAALSR